MFGLRYVSRATSASIWFYTNSTSCRRAHGSPIRALSSKLEFETKWAPRRIVQALGSESLALIVLLCAEENGTRCAWPIATDVTR